MPAVAERAEVVVVPFGIEADHPRNSDLLLQGIPNLRLRSAFGASKPARDYKTGDYVTPVDQVRSLAGFPNVPGMQLLVNPAELTYEVIDPLYGNQEMLDRISKWFQQHRAIGGNAKVRGVPPQKGKTDTHRMKTLVREMRRLVDIGHAKHVKGKGPLPDMDEIDELPGHYLLNPGARVRNNQPKFEKDFDEWLARVSMTKDLDN